MFKFSIRSEVIRKYYERSIKRFFDFIEFGLGKDIEERYISFTKNAQRDINWG
jgi:hypothetical protein